MVKRTNLKQYKALVELMAANIPLAKGFKRGNTTVDVKAEWNTIAITLNSVGPPTKDGKKWQKVWSDIKFKIKKKMLFNKKEREATGRGDYRQKRLSIMEKKISNLLCFKKLINLNGKALGIVENISTSQLSTSSQNNPVMSASNRTSIINPASATNLTSGLNQGNTFSPDPTMPPNTNENTIFIEERRNKVPKFSDKKKILELLQTQTEIQVNSYEEVKGSLSRIENYLKESSSYKRKRFYLEDGRLKLYKVQLDREEKQRIEDNKIKIMDLEVRKRQLDIEEQRMHLIEDSK